VWGSGWKEGRAHEEGLEEEGEELGIVGVGGDAAAGGHDEAPEGPEGVDPLHPRGRVHQHLWGGGERGGRGTAAAAGGGCETSGIPTELKSTKNPSAPHLFLYISGVVTPCSPYGDSTESGGRTDDQGEEARGVLQGRAAHDGELPQRGRGARGWPPIRSASTGKCGPSFFTNVARDSEPSMH